MIVEASQAHISNDEHGGAFVWSCRLNVCSISSQMCTTQHIHVVWAAVVYFTYILPAIRKLADNKFQHHDISDVIIRWDDLMPGIPTMSLQRF